MAHGVLRLAQIFDVESSFQPTKAALYLKRVGKNVTSYFDLNAAVSLDATNFNVIAQGNNKIIFDDQNSGFTNNGYMLAEQIGSNAASGDWGTVSYDIKSSNASLFRLYARTRSTTGALKVSVLLDGIVVNTIEDTSVDSNWNWFSSSFTLPDNIVHRLGIRLEGNGHALDKIYIDKNEANVSGEGPTITTSPFVTLHLQIYNANSSFEPTTSLFIYDAKNSVDEIIIDDWYNFDVTFLDSSRSSTFVSSYAIVLSASGGDDDNYVSWELVDNDEYLILPSAIKVLE